MILANTLPISPVPTTPTVLPCRSKPSSPFSEKSPSRVRATARQPAVEREDQRDRVLGDRVRRIRGHAHDRDAEPLGSREVDVVEAGRAQRDQARAAVGEPLQHRRIDGVVDERTDDVVTVREDRGLRIEVRRLKVQPIAELAVCGGKRLFVVLPAAEQDHTHAAPPMADACSLQASRPPSDEIGALGGAQEAVFGRSCAACCPKCSSACSTKLRVRAGTLAIRIDERQLRIRIVDPIAGQQPHQRAGGERVGDARLGQHRDARAGEGRRVHERELVDGARRAHRDRMRGAVVADQPPRGRMLMRRERDPVVTGQVVGRARLAAPFQIRGRRARDRFGARV
jgi:hypothetical protein